MVKRIFGLLAFVFALTVAQAQTPAHSVTLTVTDSDFSSANSGTVTFYKVTGNCPSSGVPTGGVPLNSTPLAFPGTASITDAAVTAGSTYCYYALATPPSGGAGVDSNTFQGTIQLTIPVLTGTAK